MTIPRVPLGECCEIVSGATPSTSIPSYWDGDIRWATPKDLSDLEGAYIGDTPRKITKAGLESCAASVLPAGSVLFSSRAPIGHVAVNTAPMATNQGFKSFLPKPDRVHAKFLYYWLRAHRPYLESLGNGATFKEVSKAVVSRIEIPLPPVTVQRRIADVLDRAEALRAERRATLALLDSMSPAVFREQFGDANEGGGAIAYKPLYEIVDPQRPISYGILMPGPDTDGGVRYVRVVDMKEGGIEVGGLRRTTRQISDAYRRSLLEPGDLLLSIRGHVGRLAVVPAELKGANITQDAARLALRGVEPVFVCECLRSPLIQRWMARHTKGVAVKGLNLGDVKRLRIPVPPAEAQRSFAHRVTAIEKLKSLHRASLAKLDELFASLQHRAFRGEL